MGLWGFASLLALRTYGVAMMSETPERLEPWLLAVWPGMANVAVGAGLYLVQKLRMRPVGEVPSREFFEVEHVEVKAGLAQAARLPRGVLYSGSAGGGRELLVFIGEAQPETGGGKLATRVLDMAEARGVRRVFTFASLATQLHPRERAGVHAVSTDVEGLRELQRLEVKPLAEGQIAGLNGVLLAAGVDRGMRGVCLMGEIPYFAAGVPNPKASKAVLEVFAALAGLEIDYEEIDRHTEAVDSALVELLEKMREAARESAEAEGIELPEAPDEREESAGNRQPELSAPVRAHLERLFKEAEEDRSQAFMLKEELDRLGAFSMYEDRFLDLFKRGD